GIGALVNSSSDNPNGRANASGLAVFAARDTEPPHTTAHLTPTPNGNGWNNTSVQIVLSAQDNPGGIVNQIDYSLTGAQSSGTQTVAGNAAVIDVVAEGVTTVDYHATDVAGNTEASRSVTIRIDKTSPLITGMPIAGCQLWPPNHKLVEVADVTAADALSGVPAGSLSITGQSNQPTQVNPPSIVVRPDGANGVVVELHAP